MFPNNCDGRVISVDPSTGCTLTRATIRGMTPQDFEDQGFKEVGMDRIITRAKEARMAGVMERTLETLLMSRLTPIKNALIKQPISGSESVILPYIYRRQKRNINSNYFLVSTGAATSGAGSNGIPASAYDLTLIKHAGPFATSLPELQRYFLPGKMLNVETVNATTKVAYSLQYTVLSAINADAGGVYKAKVTVVPNVSADAWGAMSAGDKAKYQPTTGLVYNLANSVSDFEAYAYNEPTENTNKLLTFWLQTSRETHQYNDEYLRALNAALTSGYFKDFRQLSLAEQKKLQHQQFMKSWMNSVFYGQEVNEKQTVETYTSLPTVTDPANSNCTLEYKAQALGFMTMLEKCGRSYDHQGNALNLNRLFEEGYIMKRNREVSGGEIDTIDFMTDRWTAQAILIKMIDWYKDTYQVNTDRWFQPNQALTFENQVVLKYNLFQLPPGLGGYNFAVFWDPYFDDKVSAFVAPVSGAAPTGDLGSRGRSLWGIDWSDFQLGIAATASKQRQTNESDNLYNTIIKANISHYMLESTTWTAILEDPSRSHVVNNFSAAAPSLT